MHAESLAVVSNLRERPALSALHGQPATSVTRGYSLSWAPRSRSSHCYLRPALGQRKLPASVRKFPDSLFAFASIVMLGRLPQ